MSSMQSLFEPHALGDLKLRNRIHMGAMTRDRAKGNVPTDLQVEYYCQRAKGGAGLIISEGTLISQQGTAWANAPGIWSQEQIDAWRNVTEAVHAEGGIIFCQLWHVGRLAHPEAPEQIASGQPVYAPSAIAATASTKFRFLPGQPGYQTPKAIPDPRALVDLYRQAAIDAKAAGFDGVELLGNGGFLIAQFLSSHSNKRTDNYGGGVENRARFGLEVLQALTEVWGPGRVAVKVMPAGGYNDAVMPLEETIETYSYFLKRADKMGLAYIQLELYFHRDESFEGRSLAVPHDVLETYRPFIKNTPIFINGEVDPQHAADLVEQKIIHGVVFCRYWISMPDVVKRLEKGLPLDVPIDYERLYGGWNSAMKKEQIKGYSDYPALTADLETVG